MNIVITAATDTVPTSLLADLAAGKATLHKERETGTFRKVHFLAEGSEARERAEWIRAARLGELDVEGAAPRTMQDIAVELHTSVSAIRRTLSDLALTEELEAMDADELEAMLVGGEEVEVPAEAFSETDEA